VPGTTCPPSSLASSAASPISIELAAARVGTLSVSEIGARLADRLALLTGGGRTAPARQQTLRASLEWSHALLTREEQVLLARLSVFAGGFGEGAAGAVCGEGLEDVAGGIGSLVRQSLVRREGTGEARRYGMLETIREYARERLAERAEVEETRRRHALFFLGLAEEAEPELQGPQQGRGLDRLQAENDNLRAVFSWAREHGETEAGLRLGGALHFFWDMRGHWAEGREILRQLLALPAPERSTGRGGALLSAGHLAFRQGDLAAARALWEESLIVHRKLGDRRGMAASLHHLGRAIRDQSDQEAGRRLIEEGVAICRELGSQSLLASSLNSLAILHWRRGEYDTARSLFEESLAVARELGDPLLIGSAQGNLAQMLFYALGEHGRAKTLLQENLRDLRELGGVEHIANVLGFLGDVALAEREYKVARAHHEESLQLRRELGNRGTITLSLNSLGEAYRCLGDFETARALHREGLELAREMGRPLPIARGLGAIGGVFIMEGRLETGVRLISMSAAIHAAQEQVPDAFRLADRERLLAIACAALGEEAFTAAWEAGRALSLEAAVALAREVAGDGEAKPIPEVSR
jgi:tetratricopeptide (TPR) repeat protein